MLASRDPGSLEANGRIAGMRGGVGRVEVCSRKAAQPAVQGTPGSERHYARVLALGGETANVLSISLAREILQGSAGTRKERMEHVEDIFSQTRDTSVELSTVATSGTASSKIFTLLHMVVTLRVGGDCGDKIVGWEAVADDSLWRAFLVSSLHVHLRVDTRMMSIRV
ncbi:hypothetical protein Tco_0580456 [Tanacetum coccineum]